MNCTDYRQLLHAHADSELDVANSVELERHLKSCAACAAEKQAIHSLKTAMRQPALRYDAPDSLRKEVRQMVQTPGDATSPRFNPLLLWKSLAFGATTFAVFVILMGSRMSGRDKLLEEAVASHVRSLMVEHITDVASSDQHTVKPWFSGKLDFAPVVKDYAAQGFPLVGGRMDYMNGRAVAALVYRRNNHLINVFVWPGRDTGSGKPAVENHRGYSVINREVDGLHYCLVSDLNDKDLAELANLFGR